MRSALSQQPSPVPKGASASPCAPESLDADANAASPVSSAAWDAYLAHAHLRELPGDHSRGARDVRQAERDAKAAVAEMLGVDARWIHPTSGGSAADALALLGTLKPGDRCVVSPLEHEAVHQLVNKLHQQNLIDVTFLPLDADGRVCESQIGDVIVPGVRLVSCLAAQNETGVIQPIQALARRCREVGALFHTDAVQAIGRWPIDAVMTSPKPHLVAVTGHKLGAVGHTGFLAVDPEVELTDAFCLLEACGVRQAGHVAGLHSLVAALRDRPDAAALSAMAALRDKIVRDLRAHGLTFDVIGERHPRLANTLSLGLWGYDAEAVVMALDQRGVAVSAGAACSSGSTEPSRALMAMGLSARQARMCVRISLQRGATPHECRQLTNALVDVVSQPGAKMR